MSKSLVQEQFLSMSYCSQPFVCTVNYSKMQVAFDKPFDKMPFFYVSINIDNNVILGSSSSNLSYFRSFYPYYNDYDSRNLVESRNNTVRLQFRIYSISEYDPLARNLTILAINTNIEPFPNCNVTSSAPTLNNSDNNSNKNNVSNGESECGKSVIFASQGIKRLSKVLIYSYSLQVYRL